jgi:DNA segregation ATPase FtsK/SpoIIIE, S-DNA-T family
MAYDAFHRPARVYPEALPTDEIVIEGPQPLQIQRQAGAWLQYITPIIGSMGSLVFVFSNPNAMRNPIVILAVLGTVLLSVLLGFFVRIQQRRSAKKQYETELQKYQRYLNKQTEILKATVDLQNKVNDRLYPPLHELLRRVTRQEHLWERRLDDNDFLSVRIGVGKSPLCRPVKLNLGTDIYADYNADVLHMAQEIENTFSQIDNQPIILPVKTMSAISLCGKRSLTRGLARSLIGQMTINQAPDDLRLLAYFPKDALDEWSWMKWLSHTRRLRRIKQQQPTDPEILNMLADSVDDFRLILERQVVPELEHRRNLGNEAKDDNHPKAVKPHFVIFIDGFSPHTPVAQIPLIDELLHNPLPGVTLICLVDHRRNDPSRLQARIEIDETGKLEFEETIPGGRRNRDVQADSVTVKNCEKLARQMTPLKLSEKGMQGDLSQDIRLLELLNIRSAEQVNIATHWKSRPRPSLLRVPIGISGTGEPLIIDLKEAADGGMGPHGIVIGATGSGKSELLRTLVTGLAVTHSPEMLSFVLVDFKGGASFADLAKLPHVAGMVTNLEGADSLIIRFLASLSGELERRQRLLREAGNLDNIKQYQTKRQSTPDLEPFPYLIIIVDEFGELLQARPEFLDLFMAIGRIGRSIGMHLLFSTQRLEEGKLKGLDSYLRYRICLRTFSAAESKVMLGTPDAFYLPAFPGVGYFKVDTSIYEMFKTALITSPYVLPNAQLSDAAPPMREYTPLGRIIPFKALSANKEAKNVTYDTPEQERATDMSVVIERLLGDSQAAQLPPAHQVWLSPLPSLLPLDAVLDTLRIRFLDGSTWLDSPPFGPLRIPIGLIDQPAEQRQDPYVLDFSGAGGHLALVGAPQSGKSTFLRTLVTSLIVTHSPQDVQIYAIDFGGGLLGIFEQVPHVGTVCGRNEREKILRTLSQMRSILGERIELFRKNGIENIAVYRERRAAGELRDISLPDVFLVIDDLGQLTREIESAEPDLIDMVATGLTYGMHIIIVTNRWPEVRPKLKDNIGMRLELKLNDPVDSDFGKAAASGLPAGIPGRGLNQHKLQYQIALPYVVDAAAPPPSSTQAALEGLVYRTRASWKGESAPQVLMLPSRVLLSSLPTPTSLDPSGVPLGLEETRLQPWYIDLINTGPHFLIFGDGECGKTNLFRVWLRGLRQRYGSDQVRFSIIDYRRTLLDCAEGEHVFAYAFTPPLVKEMLDKLKKELDSRMLSGTNITIESLRNPRQWDGPHHFLFIDDYDVLVSPTNNPFLQFGDLLSQARDIGLHVILARRVAGAARAFDQFLQRIKDAGTPGLLMSGEPQEGVILGAQKANILPPGRGYLVRPKQRTILIQSALSD